MSAIRILDWRPMRKNSLLGFAKVELPSGTVMKDANGKVRYVSIIKFNSKETRDKFSNAILDAHPEALR